MKKTKTVLLIGIVITLFYSFCAISKLLPLERIELLLYDLRYQIRGRTTPPKEIAIVAIDDKSLEKVGRWPWERSKIAAVIDILKKMGAKVIFIDVIYSEPSKDDEILKDAIKRAGNVILPIVFDFKGEKKNVQDGILVQSAYSAIANPENLNIFFPIGANDVLLPVKGFSQSADALGHINMIADKDGILRWEVMAIEYNGDLFPFLLIQGSEEITALSFFLHDEYV